MSNEESDKRLRSIISKLKQICAECYEQLPEDRSDELKDEMADLLESHCDNDGMLDLCEMTYILSSGLTFILEMLIGDVDADGMCDECRNKIKEVSKKVH